MKGHATELAGKGQQKIGELIDDPGLQAKGLFKQAEGKLQQGLGKAKEGLSKVMEDLDRKPL